jgi:hypothetical protein
MTAGNASWRFNSKFGYVSLALSFAEIVVIWVPLILAQKSGHHLTPLVMNISGTAWLIGGLGSLGFAVAGLAADSSRVTALIAIIVTVVTFLICGLPMLV